MQAPGNYGPEYKASFEAIYPELAAEFGAIHVANFLAPLARRLEEGAPVSEIMQPDGIHPNAEGVRLIVETLGPRVVELVARAREDG